MNISLNQLTATDGSITIKIEEQDYLSKVNTKIKDYAKKANIKGFRQGMVPIGVVKKMFGKSILAEEVNHIISHSISDFIKEKKLKVLGDPMPDNEKTPRIDWEVQKEFEFIFNIGMAADFKVELSSKVKIQKYKIDVDQKVLDDTMDEARKRYATPTYPEVSEATDILYGERVGATADQKNTYIPISKVMAAEQKKFIGLKKEDVIEFNAKQAFETIADQANALGLHEGDLDKTDGNASVKITHISRLIDADLNQETFDKVFGKDAVTNMDEFTAKIKETISANYERETNHMLDHEIEHYLSDNIKVDLPEEFLKNWLKNTGDGTITDEVLAKEFDDYKKSIKLDLIKNQLAEENKIQTDANDVKARAKQMVIDQFGGAAVAEQLQDRIDAIADNYLKGNDGQNFMKLYNTLRSEKIMSHIKSTITITEKAVTLDEFKKVVETHRH